MTPDDWRRLEQIVEEAADLPEGERDAFLVSQLGANLQQLAKARRLLAALAQPTELPLLEGLPNALELVAGRDDEDRRLEPGVVVAGRFEVRERLGVGGMSTVYRVLDQTLEREVALKLVRLGGLSARDGWARFRREILTARKVKHANVIAIYDAGRHAFGKGSTERYAPFFTMELIQGPTLAEALADAVGPAGPKTLPPEACLRVLREILHGLAALHAAGIVHRDLKPSNVLLEGDAEAPTRVVVSDFGLAISLAPDAAGEGAITLTGAFVGTPAYMAPEQFVGRRLTPAADLYAVGLLAFEMLVGRALFDPSRADVRTTQRFSAPEPLLAAEPLPPRWRRALNRVLDPEPSRRPQSAAALLDLLESELSRPVWTRRALLGAAGAAALGGAAWAVRRIPQASVRLPAPRGPAWVAYERGRYLWRERTHTPLQKAEAEFRRALEIDPEFGLAYSGLADCHSIRADYSQGVSRVEIEDALEAARTAVRLAPHRAEAHASLGLGLALDPWSTARPEPHFQTALQIDPAYGPALQWFGAHLSRTGRFKAGEDLILRAHDHDPVLIQIHIQLAWHYYFTGQIEESLDAVERMLTLEPDYGPAHAATAFCLLEQGRIEEASAVAAKLGPVRELPNVVTLLGYLAARQGRPERTARALVELEERRGREPGRWSFQVASLNAILGEAEKALDALEDAYREREVALQALTLWPYFDELVDRRRMVDLRGRLDLALSPRLHGEG